MTNNDDCDVYGGIDPGVHYRDINCHASKIVWSNLIACIPKITKIFEGSNMNFHDL